MLHCSAPCTIKQLSARDTRSSTSTPAWRPIQTPPPNYGAVMKKDTSSAAEHEYSLSASFRMDTAPETQIQNRSHLARQSDNQRQIAHDWLAKWGPLNIWLVLIGIVATAAILILYGLTRSPVTVDDEVLYAEPARMLASSGSLSAPMFFDIAGLNHNFFLEPPVYFLLMAGVYRVLGFNEMAARFGSAIPYIAGIVAGLLPRALTGESSWPWQTALLSCGPASCLPARLQ